MNITKSLKEVREEHKSNFYTKANLVHGNTYDYSLVNYINNHTKIDIIYINEQELINKIKNELN